MKHFAELDTPGMVEVNSHYPTRSAANVAAKAHVLATGFTATTYSHNRAGHAIRRSAYSLTPQGKVAIHRY